MNESINNDKEDNLFLVIFYQMVNDPKLDYIITWEPTYGESVVILDLEYLKRNIPGYDVLNTLKKLGFYIGHINFGMLIIRHPMFIRDANIDEILNYFSIDNIDNDELTESTINDRFSDDDLDINKLNIGGNMEEKKSKKTKTNYKLKYNNNKKSKKSKKNVKKTKKINKFIIKKGGVNNEEVDDDKLALIPDLQPNPVLSNNNDSDRSVNSELLAADTLIQMGLTEDNIELKKKIKDLDVEGANNLVDFSESKNNKRLKLIHPESKKTGSVRSHKARPDSPFNNLEFNMLNGVKMYKCINPLCKYTHHYKQALIQHCKAYLKYKTDLESKRLPVDPELFKSPHCPKL